MIQAPQMQYIPVQQPVPQPYQPQGAYNPVQYNQNPGVFYNYPTSSCYQPYCTGKPQYNGVNIEIVNPQGQGIAPQAYNQMPAQFVPVQQPVMMPQQPYVMPYPVAQAINQPPVQPYVSQPVQAPQPQIVSQPQAPVQQTQVQQAQPSPQPVAPQVTPVIEQPVAPDTTVSPETFAGRLRSNDLEAQKSAIEEVAETVKNNPTAGPVLLDTQVFDALVDIIDKDTSSLQGPSPEVIELRQKPQDQLSEAQKAQALTPSPLEKAEINKQYALYTISYMQERLNNELEKRGQKALELKDLPCIEKVIDTVKSNPNPLLRVSGIASLSHIARPEYKADLSTIFELAKADEDPNVKAAATKASENLK